MITIDSIDRIIQKISQDNQEGINHELFQNEQLSIYKMTRTVAFFCVDDKIEMEYKDDEVRHQEILYYNKY